MKSPRFEEYKKLLAEKPGQLNKWYAEQVGVSPGTISRWNKKLDERSLEDRITARVEARLRAEIMGEVEAEQEKKRKEAEALQQSREASSEARYRRQLAECGRVMVTTTQDRMIGWNGFFYSVHAGKPTEVPMIIAQQLEQIRKGERERDSTIGYFARG